MDKFNLDSHKLKYHPVEIAKFYNDEEVKPIYVEISPVANCNHKCLFCHYNYLGHKGKFQKDRLLSLVDEIANMGAKSLVFGGVGEPTINKETILAIKKAKELGLDVGLMTNGALLKENELEDLVKNLTWIRFSFNAGTAETYALVHQTNEKDYEKISHTISNLVKLKKKFESNITIGVQYILLPENKDNVLNQATLFKSMGVDYFVVKHFYSHEQNIYNPDMSFLDKPFMDDLFKEKEKMTTENFSFVVRSTENLNQNRVYNQCYGLPFILYIREDGEVYTCFSYQHESKTSLGNIYKSTLEEIWKSSTKKEAIKFINEKIDKNRCQPNCRHHQINNYLWDLKHPDIEHINFI